MGEASAAPPTRSKARSRRTGGCARLEPPALDIPARGATDRVGERGGRLEPEPLLRLRGVADPARREELHRELAVERQAPAGRRGDGVGERRDHAERPRGDPDAPRADAERPRRLAHEPGGGDRKSTRLNSSHVRISYAVFCLKKK